MVTTTYTISLEGLGSFQTNDPEEAEEWSEAGFEVTAVTG